MGRLIQLIRERRLDRVVPAYAVGAWLFVQAASIFLPAYDAPPWMMRWVIAGSIIGFPFALAIGWLLFAPDIDPKTPGRQRNWIPAGIVAVTLIVLWGAMGFYWADHNPIAAPQTAERTPAKPVHASVAVLPFQDISGDPQHAYFSDGISDELINALSRVNRLRVAARTSSFALRDQKLSVQEIGRRLGVSAVLEGSVRESGNHVRITTELVNTADGFQIWSDSYDREITDMLAVQGEIAAAIAQALTHKLAPGPAPAPAIRPEAYRKYLEAKFYLAQNTTESVVHAAKLYREAAALQPDFTEAKAGLGYALMNSAYNDGRRDLIPDADRVLGEVLTEDPANVTALVARSSLALAKRDWQGAIANQRRLIALKNTSAAVLHSRALVFNIMAMHRRALSLEKTSVLLDPLSFASYSNISNNYAQLEKWKESEDAARQSLSIVPDHPAGLELLCQALAHQRKLAETKTIAAKLAAQSPPVNGVAPFSGCAFELALYSGDKAKARAMIDAAAANFKPGTDSASYICGFYLEIGAYPEAIAWFKRALEAGETSVFEFAAEAGFADAFYQREDWKVLTETPLFKQWRAARAVAIKDLPDSES
jgi:TolB-like protein